MAVLKNIEELSSNFLKLPKSHFYIWRTEKNILGFANLANLTLNVTAASITLLDISAAIDAKSFAEGDNPTAQTLNFTGP